MYVLLFFPILSHLKHHNIFFTSFTSYNNISIRLLFYYSLAGMSADEIAAVRSSFITSIDRFCAEQNLVRTEEETLITFRFRVEEMWMDTQGKALVDLSDILHFYFVQTLLHFSMVSLESKSLIKCVYLFFSLKFSYEILIKHNSGIKF